MRATHIIATLGPATSTRPMIEKIIREGVNVVRLNFSHGTIADHRKHASLVRQVSRAAHRTVGILQDVQGPKIRLGDCGPKPVMVPRGGIVEFFNGKTGATTAKTIRLPLPLASFFTRVKKGQMLLIDDGKVELEVIAVQSGIVRARVTIPGTVSSHKGVNMPGLNLGLPILTVKDREDVRAGLAMGVDMIALSFVHTARDIRSVKTFIKTLAPKKDPLLIAKIETAAGLHNAEEIIAEVDGVMVARGDLGVELSPEEVPVAQRTLLELARMHRKPVIVATQMLASMEHASKPTRAEVNDVASAVTGQADAVMLSNETAVGEYAVEAVRIMRKTIESVEASTFNDVPLECPADRLTEIESIAHAAVQLATTSRAEGVILESPTWNLARTVSYLRQELPIVVAGTAAKQFSPLLWGVIHEDDLSPKEKRLKGKWVWIGEAAADGCALIGLVQMV